VSNRFPRAQDRTRIRIQRFALPDLRTRGELQAALDALTAFNRGWLALHPSTSPLYQSGVRYRREWPREEWLAIPLVKARGFGDCEDLAAWRAAELQERSGIPARAIPLKVRSGWHIVVQTGPGTIEDPSRRLGMGR
jgi:hypothetical protein